MEGPPCLTFERLLSHPAGVPSCSGQDRPGRGAQPGGGPLQQPGHQAQSAQRVPFFQEVRPCLTLTPALQLPLLPKAQPLLDYGNADCL